MLAWYTNAVVHTTTNQNLTASNTSGQFLFYHENKAVNSDKPCDDKPPCRIALFSNAIVNMKVP